MFESNERLMLIVDMLDGVPESHKILADLLEESGERGLAQWARARKGKLSQRLSFCLLYTSPSPRDATLSRMPSSA